MKKPPLRSGQIYHVFNKSIANYKIFRMRNDYYRFIRILDYYNDVNPKIKALSQILQKNNDSFHASLLQPRKHSTVKFISYCIMPNHYHLALKVLNQAFIYKFLNVVGIAYTRYFNTKFDRKGPLWQSSYQAVRVASNEQMLHLSRYIHLNPTTAGLVDAPEDWEFSSYRKYINDSIILNKIMHEISIRNPKNYKRFVENNRDYQKKLKIIKKALLE